MWPPHVMQAAFYNFFSTRIVYSISSVTILATLLECALSKFPCMNDGTPILSTYNSEFKCECKRQFYGPFCEYDTESKHEESVDRQIVKVVLCVFFLLLLPMLIIYLVRTLYLFLKRCNDGSAASYRAACCSIASFPTTVASHGRNVNDDSPYNAVVEAAANIVMQQQQQQFQASQTQQQTLVFADESPLSPASAQPPTITLLPLFNFPSGAGFDAMSGVSTTRHRSSRGLRRTRTAAIESEPRSRPLHVTRSLAFPGASGSSRGATFTMEEFSQLLRGIQSLQELQQRGSVSALPLPPPPYESAINHHTSFI